MILRQPLFFFQQQRDPKLNSGKKAKLSGQSGIGNQDSTVRSYPPHDQNVLKKRSSERFEKDEDTSITELVLKLKLNLI